MQCKIKTDIRPLTLKPVSVRNAKIKKKSKSIMLYLIGCVMKYFELLQCHDKIETCLEFTDTKRSSPVVVYSTDVTIMHR